MRKRLWNSFKIAFSMYSRIPMPKSEWTEENMSYAMCFFPCIGAVIGSVSYGVFRVAAWTQAGKIPVNDLFWTVLLVLIPILITGGIHMDGFLDTQDALSSYQSRERRLEILKDSHAGAFAIISCAVYLLLYTGVYSSLSEESMQVIALGFMLSRILSGLSVVTFPQARKQGMAATFSQNAAKKTTRIVLCIWLVMLGIVMMIVGKIPGILCLLSAGLMFLYYYRIAMEKFGGITGDLAGYFLQMCELVMAIAAVGGDILLKSLSG